MSAVRKPVDSLQEASKKNLLTPEEYLERERFAPARSEYVRGYVFPMGGSKRGDLWAIAGASEEHNLIVANLVGELRARLKKKPCKTYASDMKVQAGERDAYFSPDVYVVCGTSIFADGGGDVLTNPILVVEVLSPSTERYDKSAKFDDYALLPTLKDYILMSAERQSVQHYAWQENGQWIVTLYSDANAIVLLPSLDIELPLSEIYDRVEWETPA